jgi:hypothetical protein
MNGFLYADSRHGVQDVNIIGGRVFATKAAECVPVDLLDKGHFSRCSSTIDCVLKTDDRRLSLQNVNQPVLRRHEAIKTDDVRSLAPNARGKEHLCGEAQLALHAKGAIRTLKPLWSVAEVPWLVALQATDVMEELGALAVADALAPVGYSAFRTKFSHDWHLAAATGSDAGEGEGWASLSLMNRGALLKDGCIHAPHTCGVLQKLRTHLTSNDEAAEVGVRLLRLDAGARLRPHHGPGARLVAHLGVRVPDGAAMVLAGEAVHWAEGELTVFDDAYIHSVHNQGETARYILHVAFPHPDLRPRDLMTTVDSALIGSWATADFRLDFATNCTVQVTNLHNNIQSERAPLLLMFNRVADNQEQDWEGCVAAQPLEQKNSFRVSAAHGYGTVDIGITQGAQWVSFTLLNLSNWTADPIQRHLQLDFLCPVDICPEDAHTPQGWPFGGSPLGHAASGRFFGFRGREGVYPYSTGFIAVSSDWQQDRNFYFAQENWTVAYTLLPNIQLAAVRKAITSQAGVAPLSPNRARSWFWTGSSGAGKSDMMTEANFNDTLALAKSMGVELLFFTHLLSNVGDYQPDLIHFPSGLRALGDRARAAGFKVGLHMYAGGAAVCLDQMKGCAGFFCAGGSSTPCDSAVSKAHPELFIPQGFGPRDWYQANTAGTWHCHDKSGDICDDHTRAQYLSPGAGHPVAAPPPNPIQLVNVTWSRLGRYRSGGAIAFNGMTSYAKLNHSSEYNFTFNADYPTARSEFTLQMVVHPVGPTQTATQVLAVKAGEWKLQIMADGRLEWRVRLGGGWTTVLGSTVLRPGVAFVVKVTHAGGVLKIFLCELGQDFACPLNVPEGRSDDSHVWPFSLRSGTADVFFGAEVNASSGDVSGRFTGALEEIFLARLSLENISAHLFACGACGSLNQYIWDWTNPATRAFWANATAALFDEVGAEAVQFDAFEFTPSVRPWGFSHSNKTFSAAIANDPEGLRTKNNDGTVCANWCEVYRGPEAMVSAISLHPYQCLLLHLYPWVVKSF